MTVQDIVQIIMNDVKIIEENMGKLSIISV